MGELNGIRSLFRFNVEEYIASSGGVQFAFLAYTRIQSKEAAPQLAQIQRIRKSSNLNPARVISGLGPLVGQVQLGQGVTR